MKKIFWLIFPCIVFVFGQAFAAVTISSTGGWNQTVGAVNLSAGAGSDLNPTYTSANNATLIDIKVTGGDNNWRVDVSKTDGTWDSNFRLYVLRTGAGSGGGSISGGTSYIEVTAITTAFFNGSKTRSNVPVQYQLQGMSLNVSPNTYNTSVTYTVVPLP